MPRKRFSTSDKDPCNKDIFIYGPDNFNLGIRVDYDDVDHTKVIKDIEKLVELLEKHWPKP